MPRGWERTPLPLLRGGEQSAAAPGGFQPGQLSRLQNALLSGPGVIAQQPDWLLAARLQYTLAEATFAGVANGTLLEVSGPHTGFGQFDIGQIPDSNTCDIQGEEVSVIGTIGLTNHTEALCSTDVQNDSFEYDADLYRDSYSASYVNHSQGIIARSNGLIGASYDAVEVYWEQPTPGSATVLLKLRVWKNNAVQQTTTIDATLAWAEGTKLRIGMQLSGSSAVVYTEPAGGGIRSSYTATTLSPQTLNDASHKRLGIYLNKGSETGVQHRWDNLVVRPLEANAVLGVFPFEQKGGASADSQGVAFALDNARDKIVLYQLLENLTVDRSMDAYTSYTQALPPQITAFEMFGKLYFCEYARQPTADRKGMGVFDPTGAGSVSIPTFDLNAGAAGASALKFRGIAKHRGATILGWGYFHEDDPDGPHVLRFSKYGAPDTWAADTDETSAGFINVGTLEVPIVGCAPSGQYTIIGKQAEIFALDGDYSSQFYYRRVGEAHGPVSTVSMVSIGEAAVWMSDEGPAISVQGGKVELLGLDTIARRFLRYIDLLNASGVHDKRNHRVGWALRRAYDDDGNPVSDNYLTEILWWDYDRNEFYPSFVPAQIWALGTTRGPGQQLPGPTGTVSGITASEITSDGALISWTPGDTSPDVTFQMQYKADGETTYLPVTPLETGQAVYEYRLTGRSPSTLYDLRVRQVRNGQTSAWTLADDLFTTLASGTVATPQGVTVEENYRSAYVKGGVAYGYARLSWTAYYAGLDVKMRIYYSATNSFAAAVLEGEADPSVGTFDPARSFASGTDTYWWLRMENDVTAQQSSEVQATPAPLRILAV